MAMLKRLHIFVETLNYFFQDSLMNRKLREQHLFETEIESFSTL